MEFRCVKLYAMFLSVEPLQTSIISMSFMGHCITNHLFESCEHNAALELQEQRE